MGNGSALPHARSELFLCGAFRCYACDMRAAAVTTGRSEAAAVSGANAHRFCYTSTITMSRHVCVFGLIACLLAVGCSSSRPAGGQTQATTAPSSGSGSSSSRQTVPVELDDYVIRMPDTLPAGDVTFDVKNVGKHAHNIRLRGPGVDAALPNNLRGGESSALDVHLNPGTYHVTCPVGPHAMMGMRTTLTVKP